MIFCSNRFEPFGGLKSAINAAREGRPPDTILRVDDLDLPEGFEPGRVGDVELVYVAFDILYVDDGVRSLGPIGQCVHCMCVCLSVCVGGCLCVCICVCVCAHV